MPAVQFGLLVLLTKQLAGLSWKHSLIIGVIYTGLLFVVGLVIAGMLSAS